MGHPGKAARRESNLAKTGQNLRWDNLWWATGRAGFILPWATDYCRPEAKVKVFIGLN